MILQHLLWTGKIRKIIMTIYFTINKYCDLWHWVWENNRTWRAFVCNLWMRISNQLATSDIDYPNWWRSNISKVNEKRKKVASLLLLVVLFLIKDIYLRRLLSNITAYRLSFMLKFPLSMKELKKNVQLPVKFTEKDKQFSNNSKVFFKEFEMLCCKKIAERENVYKLVALNHWLTSPENFFTSLTIYFFSIFNKNFSRLKHLNWKFICFEFGPF